MKKKTLKRKLIGFIAGEKGSIGKLQALALGTGSLLASGLIPKTTEAGIIAWSWDSPWSGDLIVPMPSWSGDSWSYDWPFDDQPSWSGDDQPSWSGDSWSGDWNNDWDNAPPSVEIEVK